MRNAAMAAMLLLVGTAGFSQSANTPVKDAVTRVLNEQVSAWNKHDLEGFMAGYWHSPELTFFSGAEKSTGWEAALDRHRKRYQGEGHEMGKLDFSELDVAPLSHDSALVRGAWHLTMSDGKTPHGLFTLTFRRFPDGWKIIHDHTSTAE